MWDLLVLFNNSYFKIINNLNVEDYYFVIFLLCLTNPKQTVFIFQVIIIHTKYFYSKVFLKSRLQCIQLNKSKNAISNFDKCYFFTLNSNCTKPHKSITF
jgi:hypothetical protein